MVTVTLLKSRKEMEGLIEANGGRASSAVSADTDYLIVGEDPGSKLRKAEKLGVKTISYNELLKLIEQKNRNPKLF